MYFYRSRSSTQVPLVDEEQSLFFVVAGSHSKAIVYLAQVKNFLEKISVVDASGGS